LAVLKNATDRMSTARPQWFNQCHGLATALDTNGLQSAETPVVEAAVLELSESAASRVGEFEVRRALPRRHRRMVTSVSGP
jgi:hypothetical protein